VTRAIIGPVFIKSDDCIGSQGLQGRVCIVAATKGSFLVPSDDKVCFILVDPSTVTRYNSILILIMLISYLRSHTHVSCSKDLQEKVIGIGRAKCW